MSLSTTVFMAAAMSLHPALPPEPHPLPDQRPATLFMLASRTPRIVGAPEEFKSLRRLRRGPDNSIFGWHGGPYAL